MTESLEAQPAREPTKAEALQMRTQLEMMTLIRMKKFQEALTKANMLVELEPENVMFKEFQSNLLEKVDLDEEDEEDEEDEDGEEGEEVEEEDDEDEDDDDDKDQAEGDDDDEEEELDTRPVQSEEEANIPQTAPSILPNADMIKVFKEVLAEDEEQDLLVRQELEALAMP
ncbi:hypothetical protein CYMTET_9613 [Cymbomonas tetramitiformis]|uniref:Uncharacterized protein n=1 Tax=Cymbomonas tetramitiformis TaxID=36881 RepID=A0AAE0LEV2_9CHLO|nr:hypothetical protein CYMTET_9613 [Cymbomonas tetramitiformis]